MKKLTLLLTGILVLAGCTQTVDNPVQPEEKNQPKEQNVEMPKPYVALEKKIPRSITYDLLADGKRLQDIENSNQFFQDTYSDIPGVLTFRGNHLRTSPAYGNILQAEKLVESYRFTTHVDKEWGGGAGWTGQASVIQWDKDVLQMMNVKEAFKTKENFTEVVYASLDGNVYFFDLETGEKTRENISIENPIKGSVALDPRGYPLLYVGQGIPNTGDENIGYRIYSLIDGKLLHFIQGITSNVYRGWGAFDGAPLINKETDTMYLGGENGIFYQLKLNTVFNKEEKTITINPETIQYRYKIKGNDYQGIENSVAIYKNIAYFADNGGSVQGINLLNMTPIFALGKTDDTDATIVIEEEENTPFIYTGTEVDKQGAKGDATLRKINGLTGETVWQKTYPAYTVHEVNGGMLATPVIGKKELKDRVIFTIARYKTIGGGLMVALDKQTGEEIWRKEMPVYSWSSPVDVYSTAGKGYIIQGDASGNLHLIDGKTGETIDNLMLGYNIEASPVVFNNKIVVATRGGIIHGIDIQ